MAKAKILLIQSAQIQGNSTKRFLDGAGYDVVWAGSGMAALDAAGRQPFDLVIFDVALPDTDGLDLFRQLRTRDAMSAIPIILLTARGFHPESFFETPDGPDDYLPKPYSENELEARIFAALKMKTLRSELEQKNRMLADTVAQAETDVADDTASGLVSRRQFEVMFSKEFRRAVRFKQQMSCMLIDLDGQQLGLMADEALVKAIIQVVQRTIREVDTAAWWGDEAFMVLLPNTIRNDAVQAAARILEAVADHPFPWPDATRVTMCIGVAGLPDRNINSAKKMMEAADKACKRAREVMLPSLRRATGDSKAPPI
jgi:diguanylate cyclase (GGDEF)-like protein